MASGFLVSGLSRSSPPTPLRIAADGRAAVGLLSQATPTAAEARAQVAYARLPLAFVPGKPGSAVRYVAQGGGYSFAFTPSEALLSFVTGERGLTLGVRFVGGSPAALEARDKLPGVINDLRGSDPARWRTGIPTFSTLVYRELWSGIDLRLRGAPGQLKYEFIVRPRARVSDIRLAYRGASSLRLARDGALLIGTPLGALRDAPPRSYQLAGGKRVAVPSRYALAGTRSYGFAAGPYDAARPLVIDPGLEFSTFLGGTLLDAGFGIAVGDDGSAFVAGHTSSRHYPTTAGAFDETFNRDEDVFVSKLNRAGSALVYSTFLGGTLSDFSGSASIAVDEDGAAVVTGETRSPDYPTTGGAFDETFNGDGDVFVSKLNRAGSALVYSTFLGGTLRDFGLTIAVDRDGNAFVTGPTQSPDYPTTAGAFDESFNGAFDAFVTKLDPAGSALVYSTFLGGTSIDLGNGVAVDADGNAFVTGQTRSPDHPTTAGAFDETFNGVIDAFVTKLNRAGSALVYSTFLGGTPPDQALGIAVDEHGDALVSGRTQSPDYPTTAGAFDESFNGGGNDAFVTKLNQAGSALVYSTFLGGTSSEFGFSIAVDKDGNALVTGGTRSPDYPTTAGAFDETFNGVVDAFVSKLNGAGSLVYSTFLGATSLDEGLGIAVDEDGNAFVTGDTESRDFPTTAGAFDERFNGGADAFVTKLKLEQEDDD